MTPPLRVTDPLLCYLTGVIDTAEPSSDFKHTNGTKSHFILAVVIYRQARVVLTETPPPPANVVFSLATDILGVFRQLCPFFYDPENMVSKPVGSTVI